MCVCEGRRRCALVHTRRSEDNFGEPVLSSTPCAEDWTQVIRLVPAVNAFTRWALSTGPFILLTFCACSDWMRIWKKSREDRSFLCSDSVIVNSWNSDRLIEIYILHFSPISCVPPPSYLLRTYDMQGSMHTSSRGYSSEQMSFLSSRSGR